MKRLFLIIMVNAFMALTAIGQALNDRCQSVLTHLQNGYAVYAFEEFKSLSAKNDLTAQFYLGQCYEYGIGTKQNMEAAFRLYRRTAERGLPDAMYKLHSFYKDGVGIESNTQKSDFWLQKFTQKGSIKRLYDLSMYYDEGIKFPHNYALNPNEKNDVLIESQEIKKAVSSQPAVVQVVVNQSPTPNPRNFDSKEETGINIPENITSEIDVNIPKSEDSNNNLFALIIANESYKKVAPVEFAQRDGTKVMEYLNLTLGVDKSHITIVEDATLNDMRYEFNKLQKISEAYKGDCSFFVYYCGHGIPDEKTGNGYLLPIDGYGNDITTAYPLSDLYEQLGNLEANKVVLFTDACFSGAKKDGEMLVSSRGIAIKSKPNQVQGNLIVFSACQNDETAYSFKEKGHGLLTYYLLKRLQESNGKTTLGELKDYIVDNVGKTAIVINGKSQTPAISVSPKLQDIWKEQTLYE